MINLPTSRKVVAACVLALLLNSSFAARTYSEGSFNHSSPTAVLGLLTASSVSASANGADQKTLPVLRLTLTPEGFTPAEVTLPHGRFLLVVYNKSGAEELNLSLKAEIGGKLREARAKGRGSRWREVFNPPPGRYVLGVADHPDWACQITVTPR